MMYASFFKRAPLALFAILSFSCNKNHDETRANAASAADASAIAEVSDFPTLDAKSWANGSPISLTESRAKNVVLVEVWHPSCAICRASVPAVLALHGRFQDRGLKVSGVTEFDPTDAETELKNVLDAAHEEKMDYPTFLDNNNAWSNKHGMTRIPAFVVVGHDGKIVFRHQGKLAVDSPVYAEMAKAIETAL